MHAWNLIATALWVSTGLLLVLAPCASAYYLESGGVVISPDPFVTTRSAAGWYDYSNAEQSSSDTPDEVELAETMVISFVVAGDGELYIAVINDIPNDSTSGSASLTARCGTQYGDGAFQACRNTLQTVVQLDDPSEVFVEDPNNIGTFSVSWNWATCCTDGIMLGPFPEGTIDLYLQLTSYENMTGMRVAYPSGSATTHTQPFDIGDEVHIYQDGGNGEEPSVFVPCVPSGPAVAWGDPHFRTLDGRRYNFQSRGAFVFCMSDAMEVQTCHEKWWRNAKASVNRALAFRATTEKFVVYYDLDAQQHVMKLDDALFDLECGATYTFEDSSQLSRSADCKTLQYTNTELYRLVMRLQGQRVDIKLHPPLSGISAPPAGLCGFADCDDGSNDLWMPDGSTAASVLEFGDSWSVSNALRSNLFDGSFTCNGGIGDESIPEDELLIAEVDCDGVAPAAYCACCADVTDAELRASCEFDASIAFQVFVEDGLTEEDAVAEICADTFVPECSPDCRGTCVDGECVCVTGTAPYCEPETPICPDGLPTVYTNPDGSTCDLEFYGYGCQCYREFEGDVTNFPLVFDYEATNVNADRMTIVFRENLKYNSTCNRPEILFTDENGNEAVDAVSSCYSHFSWSKVEPTETDPSDCSDRVWTGVIDTGRFFAADGGCVHETEIDADGKVIVTARFSVRNFELTAGVGPDGEQRRDIILDREHVHYMPFLLEFDTETAVRHSPASVYSSLLVARALVVSTGSVLPSPNVAAKANFTIYTSVQEPFRLTNPRLGAKPTGIHEIDVYTSDLDCDGFGTECERNFIVHVSDSEVNPACSFSGGYELVFDAACRDGFVDCPVGGAGAQGSVIVAFDIESGDHCPQVTDTVQLTSSLSLYSNAARTTPGENFLSGTTMYWQASVWSPDTSILATSFESLSIGADLVDIAPLPLIAGGSTVAPPEMNFRIDSTNSASPSSPLDSTATVDLDFDMLAAAEYLGVPTRARQTFIVAGVLNVRYEAEFGVLADRRVRFHAEGWHKGPEQQDATVELLGFQGRDIDVRRNVTLLDNDFPVVQDVADPQAPDLTSPRNLLLLVVCIVSGIMLVFACCSVWRAHEAQTAATAAAAGQAAAKVADHCPVKPTTHVSFSAVASARASTLAPPVIID